MSQIHDRLRELRAAFRLAGLDHQTDQLGNMKLGQVLRLAHRHGIDLRSTMGNQIVVDENYPVDDQLMVNIISVQSDKREAGLLAMRNQERMPNNTVRNIYSLLLVSKNMRTLVARSQNRAEVLRAGRFWSKQLDIQFVDDTERMLDSESPGNGCSTGRCIPGVIDALRKMVDDTAPRAEKGMEPNRLTMTNEDWAKLLAKEGIQGIGEQCGFNFEKARQFLLDMKSTGATAPELHAAIMHNVLRRLVSQDIMTQQDAMKELAAYEGDVAQVLSSKPRNAEEFIERINVLSDQRFSEAMMQGPIFDKIMQMIGLPRGAQVQIIDGNQFQQLLRSIG